MATTLRILKTTRENWSENLADETIDRHPILKLLQSEGRIKYNCSGNGDFSWTAKNKRRQLTPYAEMDSLDFARNELYEKATLPTRAYKMGEAISELEMLQNKGKEAVIKIFGDIADEMKKEAGEGLCREFYIDGNATGNSKRFHGIESFMSWTTQTAGDAFQTTSNDSYAGLSTARGQNGTLAGTPEYDFWTPVIVNTNRTGYSWAANADQLLRLAIIEMNRSNDKSERLNLVLLSRAGYRALADLLATTERVVVDKGAVGIRKFGFEDTINIDGTDVTFDPDVPTTDVNNDNVYGYGFTTGKMMLKIVGPSLWHASGDDFDSTKMCFKWWVGLYGNLVFQSPKHFAKFADIS